MAVRAWLLGGMLWGCAAIGPVAAADKVPIDWNAGVTGLGFYDYHLPSLPRWDVRSASPSPVIVYRVVGHKLAATGLQPANYVLGGDVWAFVFYSSADNKVRYAQPGSGLPWIARELQEGPEAGWVLDRSAVRVDSVAAAQAVPGDPEGDISLISAGEYKTLTGRDAGAPVWRIAVKPAGFAYVSAATGTVLGG
ncbi:MAG: hypothetical protein JWM80_5885 [Cyanobacteria bacterium RYN_339]|nr:hypothetical protein [Cyanobacteria bacterium RYN_339]